MNSPFRFASRPIFRFAPHFALLALAAAGVGTAVVAAPDNQRPPMHGRAGFAGGMAFGGTLMRATQELNLTDSQRQAIRDLMKNARSDAMKQRSEQGYDITVLGDPGNANYSAALEQAKQQAAQRVQRASDLQLQVYNLLTPEQKAKLPTVLSNMKAERETRRQQRQQGKAERADKS